MNIEVSPICQHNFGNNRILIMKECWNNGTNLSYATFYKADFC